MIILWVPVLLIATRVLTWTANRHPKAQNVSALAGGKLVALSDAWSGMILEFA